MEERSVETMLQEMFDKGISFEMLFINSDGDKVIQIKDLFSEAGYSKSSVHAAVTQAYETLMK